MLIVFEGMDGIGKTTQKEFFERAYDQSRNIRGLFGDLPLGISGRAPGSHHPSGELIRRLVFNKDLNLSFEDEVELMVLDMHEQTRYLKASALNVMDRWFHSTFAYQCHASGIDVEDRERHLRVLLNRYDIPVPDLVIVYIPDSPESSEQFMLRAQEKSNKIREQSKYEQWDQDRLDRIEHYYRNLVGSNSIQVKVSWKDTQNDVCIRTLRAIRGHFDPLPASEKVEAIKALINRERALEVWSSDHIVDEITEILDDNA